MENKFVIEKLNGGLYRLPILGYDFIFNRDDLNDLKKAFLALEVQEDTENGM